MKYPERRLEFYRNGELSEPMAAPMKILLADDDPHIHLIVTLWLNRNGHEVISARNGSEALKKLKSEIFDGLITDVNMPLMKGVDLVKEVLSGPCSLRMIVVLTSRCDTTQLRQELEHPRVYVFNKPFSPARLTELIDTINQEEAPTDENKPTINITQSS